MASNNRSRILLESVTLFNHAGVATVSTNHICESLSISPGNLYFHFKNKEAIVRELFTQMCEETYALWKAELKEETRPPMAFIDRSLEIFWKYRFFHREMYHLRRQDPQLSSDWHRHLAKTRHFMKAAYAGWAKGGWMMRIEDVRALRVLSDLVLLTASSFFQFYESTEKPATGRPLRLGKEYLGRVMLPHFTPKYREEVLASIDE
ncbi:MAG: TetR/AcrR family transcriptional regulator [Proteobacteria bacterium]|nr:MAG: TetR/AcrR family transcriptional regulator [Pseudomonadota bacterium]